MYLSLLLLPMFGSAVAGLLGRKIGVTGAHIITCSCLITSAILAIVAFYEVGLCNSPVSINLISWIDSELMDVSWGFMFDSLTVSMLLPVLVVSSLVHIFSVDYMSADPHNQRFFAYLSMFTFFMLVLVTGDNYLIMFVGWEGIGISSYLLINFWFTRIQANKSAIKALVVNRVGDMFLSIGFFAIFFVFGNLDYSTVFSIAPFINETIITIIGLLLLLAAMGKSAQLGLHTWLPDAMEGPTPVSALIHAATLVTAGVYLLLRSSPVIEYGPTTLIVITWVGALTAFFAASTGLLQNDLKRVIAYSTCSQMGYLFMACGLSQYNVALFHLVNHAFFKALLFLAAGAVLHATYDQQDQRRLGGLIGFLPFTYTAILIGSLSLMALPWLTGFYSKDLILEVAYGQYEFSGQVAYWLGTLSACLTAFYSLRLISLTFLTYPNASKSVYLHTHDAPTIVMIPLIILSLLAIFFGYVARDLFVGMGSDFLSPSLFTHPSHISLIEAEFGLPQIIKLLPAIGTLMGAGLALYLYHILPVFTIDLTNNTLGQKLYRFFNGKYYVDVIYNHYIINGALQVGYIISKVLDRGIIELVGPHGLATGLTSGSKDIAKLDTGNLTSYALYLAIALVTLVMILLSPVLLNTALINAPLILVLLVAMVCIPYISSSSNDATISPYPSSKNLVSFVLPLLFIYTDAGMVNDVYYFEDVVFSSSIASSVFISSTMANYRKSSLEFITSIQCRIYATMLKLFMSPLLPFFVVLALSMLINIFLITDPVYCAEEIVTNSASTSTATASIYIDIPTTAVRTINLEHNDNSMVDFAAKTTSGAMDAAAATSTGVILGNSMKIWLQRPIPVENNTQNSNSGSNINSNVNSGNLDYTIHSPLEEGDSINSFMESF